MITVRRPTPRDEVSVQQLLAQLGYKVGLPQVRIRLQELSSSGHDAVLVADDGNAVLGLVALHWTSMLQHPAPIARITTLVVHEDGRGEGVGRLLVEAGSELAKQAGCGTLELTTALHRTEAHAFYRALRFDNSSLKFSRPL